MRNKICKVVLICYLHLYYFVPNPVLHTLCCIFFISVLFSTDLIFVSYNTFKNCSILLSVEVEVVPDSVDISRVLSKHKIFC